MEIRDARPTEMDQIREMFREYQGWVDNSLCFESFEAELARLPGAYSREHGGALLVAVEGMAFAGCVGLRRLDERTAEMKRLYLREAYRGRGAGEAMVEAVVARARDLGYGALRLDTLLKMEAAQKLYERLGFRDIERYNDSAVEQSRFMEKDLG